jgi:hypothetical protein
MINKILSLVKNLGSTLSLLIQFSIFILAVYFNIHPHNVLFAGYVTTIIFHTTIGTIQFYINDQPLDSTIHMIPEIDNLFTTANISSTVAGFVYIFGVYPVARAKIKGIVITESAFCKR